MFCPDPMQHSLSSASRYSVREGVLIYNQHDLKMIWVRLLALMLVVSVTVPLITYSLKRLLVISNHKRDEVIFSLFDTTTSMLLFYTLLVLSVSERFFQCLPS